MYQNQLEDNTSMGARRYGIYLRMLNLFNEKGNFIFSSTHV